MELLISFWAGVRLRLQMELIKNLEQLGQCLKCLVLTFFIYITGLASGKVVYRISFN